MTAPEPSVSPERLALASSLLDAIHDAAGPAAATVERAPFPFAPPGFEEMTDDVGDFMRRVFPSERQREVRVGFLAEHFDEAELRGLLAFFSSPLGRKYSASGPLGSQRYVGAHYAAVAAHADEWQAMTRRQSRESMMRAAREAGHTLPEGWDVDWECDPKTRTWRPPTR